MEDQAFLAGLLERVQDLVVVLDEEGTIQYENAAVERVLGYERTERLGEDAFEHVHPEDRDDVWRVFASVVAADGEQTATVEHRHRTADGEWRWLESVVSTRDDAISGYVVSSRDVTDRKAAERARAATRRRLVELAEQAYDVLWMFTGDWSELLFVNSAYEAIYGQPVAELQADPSAFLEAIHPDDRPDVRDAMERLSAGESVGLEYRVNPDEEFRRWVWVRGTPIGEDGDVERIAGFSREVTERRHHRQQLRVIDRVLRHNIHNDMNVVLGFAEQARAVGDEEVADLLENTLRRGRKLLRTVDKQRRVVELVTPNPSPEPVDVAATVRAVADATAESHPDATVAVDAPEEAEALAIEEFGRVVEELLENAVTHGGESPTVEVSVRVEDDAVELVVADDGPPIPEEELLVLTGDHEVDPLFHGSGLGLWLVNWGVVRSNGDLAFERREPSGNRVTIRLQRPGGGLGPTRTPDGGAGDRRRPPG